MQLQHCGFSSPLETLRKATRAVDEETGIIRFVYETPTAPDAPQIFAYGSLCGDIQYLGQQSSEGVSGSTSIVRNQAIAGAIGEAIERYSAAFIPYERLVVKPYIEVAEQAISPWSLIFYDCEQYEQTDFPYRPLSKEAPIGWIAGYSLTRNVPVLVPAFAVYMPYQSNCEELPVYQQITTGLACGNTLEEAILSALCEVVERDASMLMWLQSRQPPKVILGTEASTPQSIEAFRRFGSRSRYISVFDVTTDLCIPSYVAVWNGPLGTEQGAVFASSASLCADRAVTGALNELAQCMIWVESLLKRRAISSDPNLSEISEIQDHVLWPARRTNHEAFSFLLSSKRSVYLEERTGASSLDVLDNINKCVTLIGKTGLEVIVVDVTSPDVGEIGFNVVRVIIPGVQPLFFGSNFRILSQRSHINKYTHRATNDINLHPHPFP